MHISHKAWDSISKFKAFNVSNYKIKMASAFNCWILININIVFRSINFRTFLIGLNQGHKTWKGIWTFPSHFQRWRGNLFIFPTHLSGYKWCHLSRWIQLNLKSSAESILLVLLCRILCSLIIEIYIWLCRIYQEFVYNIPV